MLPCFSLNLLGVVVHASQEKNKLKAQQQMYEQVRSDRNLFSKLQVQSEDEIAEVRVMSQLHCFVVRACCACFAFALGGSMQTACVPCLVPCTVPHTALLLLPHASLHLVVLCASQLNRKFKIMNHQIEQLKEEMQRKDNALIDEQFAFKKLQEENNLFHRKLTKSKASPDCVAPSAACFGLPSSS
jgi:hypothetical protein